MFSTRRGSDMRHDSNHSFKENSPQCRSGGSGMPAGWVCNTEEDVLRLFNPEHVTQLAHAWGYEKESGYSFFRYALVAMSVVVLFS